MLSRQDQDVKTREQYALEACQFEMLKGRPDALFMAWASWYCPVESRTYQLRDEFRELILDKEGHVQWRRQQSLSLDAVHKFMALPKRAPNPSSRQRFVDFCKKHDLKPSLFSIWPLTV